MENGRKAGPLSLQSALHWTAVPGNIFHLPWPWHLQGSTYWHVLFPSRQAGRQRWDPSPCLCTRQGWPRQRQAQPPLAAAKGLCSLTVP